MKNIILIISMATLLIASVDAETLYRWVDSEGKVHYGDRPAEDATSVEQKKFKAPTMTADDLLPFETRQARQNFPVTLYLSESCGTPCVQASELLNKRGIPYAEKVLVSKEDEGELRKLTGSNGVPALAIGRTILTGFEAGQWGNELDVAGYPKIAPIGARLLPTPAKSQQAESSVPPAAPAE